MVPTGGDRSEVGAIRPDREDAKSGRGVVLIRGPRVDLKGDLRAILRPLGASTEIAHIGRSDPRDARSVDGTHHVDAASGGTIADERDLGTVWRPGWEVIRGRIVREPDEPAAVRVHRVDLIVPVAVRRKRD